MTVLKTAARETISAVIIVETLAKFSFPSHSMLIWKTFMPKQTRETRKESHTCIHETTKFMFVFSVSVSTN